MSAAKKPAGKAAAKSKAAAARAERKPKAKSLTWKGMKFELPAVLPEAILFDFIEMEAGESDPAPVFRMLRSLIGPPQFRMLRNAIERGDADSGGVFELVEKILEKYGVTQGESSASQDS